MSWPMRRSGRALVGVSPVPVSGVPFDDDGWRLFSGAAAEPANRRAIIDFATGNRLTGVWLDVMVRHSLDDSDQQAFADYLQAWAKTDIHTEIEVLANVGHYAIDEAPVALATAIEKFLAGV